MTVAGVEALAIEAAEAEDEAHHEAEAATEEEEASLV